MVQSTPMIALKTAFKIKEGEKIVSFKPYNVIDW